MTGRFAVSAGQEGPLGVTLTETGANIAVFSEHATAIELCLFAKDGREIARRSLPERLGHVWFGHVADIGPGQIYGLRAHGPFAPSEGHRFNPAKLLIDPYARQITGPLEWHEAQGGGTDAPDPRDSAPHAPKCVVPAPLGRYEGARPAHAWRDTVIYEAHPAGLTRQWPGLEHMPPLEALASEPVLAHLRTLGVTAIELLPCHAFMSDRFLMERGLQNYWGYQSIGFFAPHSEYLQGAGPEAFPAMVRRFHEAGIEVILDVV
ncbi:MAG: glycogen debranching enzyme GlgX, partial [Pseudomonadota bacterium]